MCMRGQKKSGLKFLLGAEYDSWVLKFERRKKTQRSRKLKRSRTKKTDQKSNSRNCFSMFSSKILSRKKSEKNYPFKKAIFPANFGIAMQTVYLPEVLSFSAHIVNGII